MHTALCLAALAGIAYSAPQLINLDAIAQEPAPVLVKAPLIVESDTPPDVTAAAVVPITTVPTKKRDLDVVKRDGDCSAYPPGAGPTVSPDTPEAFQQDPDFAATAQDAPTPDGYKQVFDNLDASLQASNYMGLYTLDSYDTLTCASKCDQADGCQAFNVYFERDPTVNANEVDCPNPPSTTNYRCTLWGAPVSPEEATNSGQYQAQFHVVIAGSNAYNKAAPPPAINGYTGPQELGGAINAPTDSGSYMGYQYFPFSQSQGYDPQTCADACDAQTTYDSQHPAADGSFMSCVFFNAYVLSKNAIPQGLYCSMYNETWGPSYGTNYGQYQGSDRYTVSESYSYSKSSLSGNPPPSSSTSSASSSSARSSSASSTLSSSSVSLVSSQTSSSASSPASTQASSAISSTVAQTTSTSGPTSAKASSAISSSAVQTTSVSNPTSSLASSTASSSAPPTTSASSFPCGFSSNNLVQNGGFECGLSPWNTLGRKNSTLSITSPGDNSMSAFEFDQTGPHDDTLNYGANVNQDLYVTVGQSYQVSYRYYIGGCDQNPGRMEVYMYGLGAENPQIGVQLVESCDFKTAAFRDYSYTFTAPSAPLTLQFEFDAYGSGAVMKIDNVAVVPVATPSNPSPSFTAPVVAPSCTNNIIQNGGFETGGIAPWSVSNPIGQVNAGIFSPGSPNIGGGNYAFDGYLKLPTNPYAGHVGLTLSQTLNTCPGTNYSISLDYNIPNPGPTLTLSYGSHGSISARSPYNTWTTISGTFTATGTTSYVSIVLAATSPGSVYLDTVKVAYYPYPAVS